MAAVRQQAHGQFNSLEAVRTHASHMPVLDDIVEEVQTESLYDDTATMNESTESEEKLMYDYDIEDLLNDVAIESGLDADDSDYVNDDEIEAILEATAEECGLNGDNSVDSLLENFTEAMDL